MQEEKTTTKAGARTQSECQFVIRSIYRGNNAYFAAIHGYGAMFFGEDKARRFPTREAAHEYAIKELFETEDAFCIEDSGAQS